jgi:hypothetical protein
MLETYLDESDNPIHKRFSVGALVIDQASKGNLLKELDSLTSSIAFSSGKDPHFRLELHGVNVYNGNKQWRGIPTRLRLHAYRKTLEITCRNAIGFIVKPINYDVLRYRDPHHLAMLWALERVQDIASDRSTSSLLFADRKPESEKGLRQAFEKARIIGTGGWRSTRLSRIDENVSFQDSSHNRLIQACDMALFIHHREVFDRLQHGSDLSTLPPDKAKSIVATRELNRIITPIKRSLPPWP